jgi:hypothetical protein
VELRDAFRVIVNPDLVTDLPGHLANAMTKINDRVRDRGIEVLLADVANPDEVSRKVLEPVLAHLAERLAEMDRACISAVLRTVDQLSQEIGAFADTVLAQVNSWRAGQLNERNRLHGLARGLRDKVSRDLFDLMQDYDTMVADGALDQDLKAAIQAAADKARREVDGGFGKGRDAWVKEMHNAIPARGYGAREEAYNRARLRIADIFDDIDASLERAVRRLWSELARTLARSLTEELVPGAEDGQAALTGLKTVALTQEAQLLPEAVDDLLALRDDYGSLVLRVTRPILRGISFRAPQPAHPSVLGAAAAGAVVGAVIAGAVAVHGHPAAVAPMIGVVAKSDPVKDWWNQRRQPTTASGFAPSPSRPPTLPRPATDGAATTDGGTQPPYARFGAADGDTPDRAPAASTTSATDGSPGGASPGGGAVGAGDGSAVEAAGGTEADALFTEMSAVVLECVRVLEGALLAEAQLMPRALAAAVDRFWDTACVPEDSYLDFESICGPIRERVWPGEFDGAESVLAIELANVAERARDLGRDLAEVHTLSGALRLRPPGPSGHPATPPSGLG